MRLDLLARLNAARAARRAAVLVTDLDAGDQRLVLADAVAGDDLRDALETRMRSGLSGRVERDGRQLFLDVHVPSRRLVMVGAVHISQALAAMAARIGLDVTVVDPRTAFASPERFEGVPLVAEWPDDALPRIGLDPFTALAAVSHEPRIDDPALRAALAADCFYVGALGSRKSHAARLARLAEAGVAPEAAARIHAPIGLDIGAVSPAEIAVAILGEVIAAMRRKPPRPGSGELPTTARG